MINIVLFLAPIALAVGGGAALYSRYVRYRHGAGADDRHSADAQPWPDERVPAAFRRVGESRGGRLALEAASLPLEIRWRNWRSPGMRALGLRRADARTGGPISVRRAVVRRAVLTASHELTRAAQRRSWERFRERQRRMKADLELARLHHPDDREARERAMREAFRRHRVTPWGSFVRAWLGSAPLYLPALWSERNQTLPDLVAGIVVVRD